MILRALAWPFVAPWRGLKWALAAVGRGLAWPFVKAWQGLRWAFWASPGAVRFWTWTATVAMSLLAAVEANYAKQIVIGVFSVIFFGVRDAFF